MLTKTCEIRLEDKGVLSIKMMDGKQYVIDLSSNGVTDEVGSNRAFMTLVSTADEMVHSAVLMSGLRMKVDARQWGQGATTKS
jgi:hypothetical protein